MTRFFGPRKATQEEFERKIKKIVEANVENVKRDMELEMERNTNKLQTSITKLEDENKELKIEIAALSRDIHYKNVQIGCLVASFVGYLGYTNYMKC